MSDLSELGFDAQKVEPNAGFDIIPAGDYSAVIVASEVKTTSGGDGRYLKLQLQILDGKFQNRKLFENLNLWNKSDEAVKIAKGTLSAICRAVNVMTPKNSEELHNKPLCISVKIKKDQTRGDQNTISSYKSRTALPASAPSPTASSPSTTEQRPWG